MARCVALFYLRGCRKNRLTCAFLGYMRMSTDLVGFTSDKPWDLISRYHRRNVSLYDLFCLQYFPGLSTSFLFFLVVEL